MRKYEHIEKKLEKKYSQQDKKRKKQIKVSGKSVFKLAQLISKKTK